MPSTWSAASPRRLALYFIAFFAIGLAHWLALSFDSPSVEQILFHLRYNEGLIDKAAETFLVTFAVECIAFPVVWTVCAAAAERALRSWATLAPSLVLLVRRGRAVLLHLPVLAIGASLVLLLSQVSAFSYVGSRFGHDYFSGHYVDPSKVQVRPRAPKNLVLIYVESLEDAYGDRRVFRDDLTASLEIPGALRFPRYLQAPGAGWTMGGIVSTQCGAPLRSMTMPRHQELSERLFMRNAVCLGDVLKSFDYQNVFMGGAQLTFAGKGRFLADHGYDRVYGKQDWLQRGYGHGALNEWGLHDDDLLHEARKELRSLQESGRRFNLTLLTLDTHHPTGYYSKTCRAMGATDFEGIVKCTSRQIADFIEFARQNGYLENTNIVVLGDHLAMPNPVHAKLQDATKRTIFNRFVSDEPPVRFADQIVPFDMFPTLLEFIGFEVVGGRLGLGHSGLSGSVSPRTPQEFDDLMSNVLNPSDAYSRLWMTSER